jgi:hypothetical protein
MNAHPSTVSRYMFDMVTGVTQAPGATTMKQFLDHIDGKEFAMCYVEKEDPETGDWVIVPIDYSTLKQKLGIDPFSLADNDTTSPYAERLYNEFRFVFGFKATMNKSGLGSMSGLTYSLRWLYPSKNVHGIMTVAQQAAARNRKGMHEFTDGAN